MKICLQNLWKEEDGVLAFEWTLLVTLLTIGIVSGLAAARDAIIDELGDVAQAMLAVDQSYTIDFPLEARVHETTIISSASDSAFTDAASYIDCTRTAAPVGQPAQDDNPA
jgi:Flp pilus assembly pilin Flp